MTAVKVHRTYATGNNVFSILPPGEEPRQFNACCFQMMHATCTVRTELHVWLCLIGWNGIWFEENKSDY